MDRPWDIRCNTWWNTRCDIQGQIEQRGHRAVGEAGWHGADTGTPQRRDNLGRRQLRGQVDIGDRTVGQRITHRATDHARARQRGEQRGEGGGCQERGRRDP